MFFFSNTKVDPTNKRVTTVSYQKKGNSDNNLSVQSMKNGKRNSKVNEMDNQNKIRDRRIFVGNGE